MAVVLCWLSASSRRVPEATGNTVGALSLGTAGAATGLGINGLGDKPMAAGLGTPGTEGFGIDGTEGFGTADTEGLEIAGTDGFGTAGTEGLEIAGTEGVCMAGIDGFGTV